MTQQVIAIAGASGLVGRRLENSLTDEAHEVRRLVRRPAAGESEIEWSPQTESVDSAGLSGVDGVVNLAGYSVAAGRWSRRVKSEIRDSRVRGTRTLANALARLDRPPAVWVNASAVGFYGDCANTVLDESRGRGSGFLADVCGEWEDAVAPAVRAGVRVVLLRIGVVLAGEGGALAQMLPIFRTGLGGRLGSGRQYMSWIGLDDLVRAIRFSIDDPGIEGPVNATAPLPVSNAEFTRVLGRVLRRPAVLAVPAFAIRLAAGEMGQELLLASIRAAPTRLLEAGFEFHFEGLEAALRHALSPRPG
jgi:uncharacterized protein (TIGR01777 family)